MSITKHATVWHGSYEEAVPVIKEGVDAAYTAARKALEERGFDVANDDRAEALVAAIMEYLTESAVPRRS